MTTYHTTRETDGVPAPSDIELAPPRPRRYGFNGATKLLKINRDRERFHRWAGRFVNLSLAYRKEAWRTWYAIFRNQQEEDDLIQAEDARDEHNERRHIDGHDERLDPHLDAFV